MAKGNLIIGIDHGNRNMKTPHCVFTSGYIESDFKSDTDASDTLEYNGKYYSISQEPFNVVNDKTENDNFFILSLFAIAKEMLATNQAETNATLTLAIGLPPRDYNRLKGKYEEYFLSKFKEKVNFSYSGKQFSIKADKCYVFPQGFAAAMASDKSNYLLSYSSAFVLDLGGYTVDYMEINEKCLNKNRYGSEPFGIISLIEHIISVVSSRYGRDLTYKMVEGVIAGKNVFMKEEIKECILEETAKWIDEKILGCFTKKNIDLQAYPVVFIGGGSILLHDYISNNNKLELCEFVDNISANAVGYLLYASAMEQ